MHKRSNSQDSNTAGTALPRIPRRSSSSRMPSTSTTPERSHSPLIQIQQATPPELVFAGVPFPRTPPAEPSYLTIRARRLQRHSIEDIDPMSPTPQRRQTERRELPEELLAVLSPPSTSVSLDSVIPVLEFPSSAPILTSKSFSALHYCPPTLYTKSGRPIKSSLKSPKLKERGSLAIFTAPPATKSEPVTPKAVHFDTQLEHVKLFLSAQKPAAVSRTGSPTDDTSGNESSDFPGLSSDDQEIVMRVQNMPGVVNGQADLTMQEIKMTEDRNIGGSIRVRNLAFQKWVAVRFTFDSWQTTSEVAARYATTEDSEFDIFAFTIKLTDMLSRIEEKTLVLAIHYRVNGGDVWDNNGGQNYVTNFSRTPRPAPVPKPRLRRMPSSDDEGVSSDDLRNRLEKVVRSRGVLERPSFLRRPSVDSPSRSRSPSPVNAVDGLPAVSQPIPRYEFDLKRPWDGAPRARVATYPMATSPPSTIPFPSTKRQMSFPPSRVNLGSPRDTEVAPAIVSRTSSAESIPPRLHHQGFFDGLFQDVAKATDSLSSDRQVFSPLDGSNDSMLVGLGLTPLELPGVLSRYRLEEGASEDSTPPIMSPSWSSSTTPSPTDSFQGEEMTVLAGSPGTSYRHFVNKFCFFTGPGEVQFLSPETSSLASSPPSAETLTSFASSSSIAMDDPLNEFTNLRSASTTPTASESSGSDATISLGQSP